MQPKRKPRKTTKTFLNLPSPFARIVHISFEIGILIKGFDGLLEILGGLLLQFLSPEQINEAVLWMTQHELSRDPNDWLARHMTASAEAISMGAKTFAIVYLLLHGVLKVLIVWALLRSKLWAFPIAVILFAVFDVYQLYRFALSPSAVLATLVLLDIFIIIFTWGEYRRLRRSGKA